MNYKLRLEQKGANINMGAHMGLSTPMNLKLIFINQKS